MKYFLIMNPGSRSGKSGRRFDRLFGLLSAAGIQYEHAITTSLGDALDLSRQMNRRSYDAIVAVGGDGTINAVINGFYDDTGKCNSSALFGVIYTGTSPDFCRSYGIPTRMEQAVDCLVRARTRDIPIGRITCSTRAPEGKAAGNEEQAYYFACCANIGLGAALARRANSGIRKYLGDLAGTFVSLIITLASYKAVTFNRIIDGHPETIHKMVNTSVGITPFIASGIKVPLSVHQEAGTLYCMTVKNLRSKHLLPLLKKVYGGRYFTNSDYLTLSICREVAFPENGQTVEVEFDGDPAGFLPCRISLAAETIQLIS